MKSIGIIRRIDELGRIVIPKEIRNNLKITENDKLEVFLEEDKIFIKKHTILDKNLNIINIYGNVLNNITSKNVIITNRNNIIFCNSIIQDKFLNKELNDGIIGIINDRKSVIGNELEIIKNIKIQNYIAYPIIINSDSIGLIVLFGDSITDKDKISIEIISKIVNQCLE